MKILVTGGAGFIGFHTCLKLIKKGYEIYTIDNINDYYDVNLKLDRIKKLKSFKNFFFIKISISNFDKINELVKKNKIQYIVHLAAQAGVRYSVENPKAYFESNLAGFFNILEVARLNKINHFIFASTSSVYGNSKNFPLHEKTNTDKPLSFYAATKKSNEVMAYSYSNIYNLPTTALRFFTVYGPLGRPDMSLYKFTNAIINNKKIELFNHGNHIRDFTYVDDIVEGIVKLILKPSNKTIPYNCFNIASGNPQQLKKFIKLIEKNLKKKSLKRNLPLQLGDVKKTYASIQSLKKYVNYVPKVSIEEGIENFIQWFKNNK